MKVNSNVVPSTHTLSITRKQIFKRKTFPAFELFRPPDRTIAHVSKRQNGSRNVSVLSLPRTRLVEGFTLFLLFVRACVFTLLFFFFPFPFANATPCLPGKAVSSAQPGLARLASSSLRTSLCFPGILYRHEENLPQEAFGQPPRKEPKIVVHYRTNLISAAGARHFHFTKRLSVSRL